MKKWKTPLHALVVLLALAPACALTSKSTPVDIRWFSADLVTTTGAHLETRGAPKLSLGRVTSGSFLRNQIVVRTSSHEVTTYNDSRWTEYPETYLRRSLARALFESGRFEQALGGALPTLDVELIAFEEVRRGDPRTGHVELRYRLREGEVVRATGTVDVERPAPSNADMAAVVAAIAQALDEATTRVSKEVGAFYETSETWAPPGSGR